MKKFLLIRTTILLVLLLLFYLGNQYLQTLLNYRSAKEKYTNRIGYIHPKNAVKLDTIEKYEEGTLYGFYSSSAPEIYLGSKYRFEKYIFENYENKGYTDDGYLNLRFYINEKGSVFKYEVNELNLNLEQNDLNDGLVNQLVSLSLRDENWHAFHHGHDHESYNYYMYLLFRIENGNIKAIIP